MLKWRYGSIGTFFGPPYLSFQILKLAQILARKLEENYHERNIKTAIAWGLGLERKYSQPKRQQ
jgi:hypothetical protein